VVAGLLVPRPRPDLGARRTPGPPGISHVARGQGRDSLDYPLDGVRPSYTVFPDARAAASQRAAPLLGFLSPSAYEEERVHVHLAVAPPVARRVLAVPTPPASVSPTGFLNLSATFFLSPPSCHFQAGSALGVSPFRGFVLPRSPDDSSPSAYPLGLVPSDCASPRPRRERPGASPRSPRIDRVAPLWPSGFLSSWKSVRVTKSRFNVSMTDLPLVGFDLLMVSTLASSGSRRAPSCFTGRLSVDRHPTGCRPRYSAHGSRPSLTRGSSHPKVPCLRPLSCLLAPDAGIFGLRLFT